MKHRADEGHISGWSAPVRGKNSGNQLTDKNLNAEAAQDVKDNASKSGLCRPSLTLEEQSGRY
ncbi:hypothetical protein [Paraburkholderia sp. BL27I4N3]|uniref:hypothetical protein n=1 Tax=Paraburkholderia sp. BL27I4N3 TaxID=1938805 RepID=UPI0011C05792|nr:hypothetical protein [Paraburkholderia sp. BL27I4N3]